MKRIIALSKQYKAFGRGSIEFLQPENHKVLTYLRRYQGETILVIANLSHLGQQTRLDLKEFNGYRLINLFGPVEFAPVTAREYQFTLGPYAYYWFALQPRQDKAEPSRALKERAGVPVIVKAAEALFENESRASMEILLQNYLKGRRWFRSKARDIQWSRIKDVIPTRSPECPAYFVLIEVNYVEGEPETYAVPLSVVAAERVREIRSEQPQSIVAILHPPDGSESLLCDAMLDKNFCKFLLQSTSKRHRFKGENGQIVASSAGAFPGTLGPDNAVLEPTPIKAEQTNTSIVFGDKLIFKLFRQLGEAINPKRQLSRIFPSWPALSNITRRTPHR